jgi:hypothetical protein
MKLGVVETMEQLALAAMEFFFLLEEGDELMMNKKMRIHRQTHEWRRNGVVGAERDERNGKGDRRDEPTHHSRGGYIWGAMVVTGICAAPAPARVGGRSAWEPRGGGATGSVTTRGAGDWAGRGGGHMVARHREEEELGGQIASVPGDLDFG